MEDVKQFECCNEECECAYECAMEHVEIEEEDFSPVEMYNEYEFLKGIESVSHLCGQVVALVNAGLTNEEVIQLITLQASVQSEREAQAHEKHIVSENAKMQVRCEEIKAKASAINDLFE